MSCDLTSLLNARLDVMRAYMVAGKTEEAINRVYTDTCKTVTCKQVIEGRRANTDHYMKHFKTGDDWVCDIEEADGDGQYAFARGTFKIGDMSARFVTIFKKVDGEFRIHIDTLLM